LKTKSSVISPPLVTPKQQIEEHYQELVQSFLNSLKAIGSSCNSLENSSNAEDVSDQKYLQKIKEELEHLRKLINYKKYL